MDAIRPITPILFTGKTHFAKTSKKNKEGVFIDV